MNNNKNKQKGYLHRGAHFSHYISLFFCIPSFLIFKHRENNKHFFTTEKKLFLQLLLRGALHLFLIVFVNDDIFVHLGTNLALRLKHLLVFIGAVTSLCVLDIVLNARQLVWVRVRLVPRLLLGVFFHNLLVPLLHFLHAVAQHLLALHVVRNGEVARRLAGLRRRELVLHLLKAAPEHLFASLRAVLLHVRRNVVEVRPVQVRAGHRDRIRVVRDLHHIALGDVEDVAGLELRRDVGAAPPFRSVVELLRCVCAVGVKALRVLGRHQLPRLAATQQSVPLHRVPLGDVRALERVGVHNVQRRVLREDAARLVIVGGSGQIQRDEPGDADVREQVGAHALKGKVVHNNLGLVRVR
eukprot:PhM_4_TR5513/c0_g1_i1/m.101458